MGPGASVGLRDLLEKGAGGPRPAQPLLAVWPVGPLTYALAGRGVTPQVS